MLKRIMACAAALVVAVGPAFAENACRPLEEVANEIISAGIPTELVIPVKSPDLTMAYAQGMGIELPEGFAPIGFILVGTPAGVIVHFVEPEMCVTYTAVVPIEKHKEIMEGLKSKLGTPA